MDAALDVCLTVRKPGETLTQRELADICNCSRTKIFNIEKKAMGKLRKRLARNGMSASDLLN